MKYCDVCHFTYPNEFTTCPKDQALLRVTSDIAPGSIIRDKYLILEKIGSGVMAAVYRARHLAFNEICALKVVSTKLMDDDAFIRRFKTEAVVTRRLQHPNAVRVDDLDTTEDGRPFIVMECVEGRDLRALIQREGPLQVDRALNIARQVASALTAAHALGITHRDIKPDNILLVTEEDGSETVKVLDFGIAKVREGAMDLGGGYTATKTGMVVGTPQYISPEQAMGKQGDAVDGRADLYSLGVVLYEMLTGHLPFDSDTPVGLLLHHIQTIPTPPHELCPELDIPEALSLLLMKALEGPYPAFPVGRRDVGGPRPAPAVGHHGLLHSRGAGASAHSDSRRAFARPPHDPGAPHDAGARHDASAGDDASADARGGSRTVLSQVCSAARFQRQRRMDHGPDHPAGHRHRRRRLPLLPRPRHGGGSALRNFGPPRAAR